MERRRARPRRIVSPRMVRVLRLLGWRYSLARRAWVHRIGGGRRGPVFRVIEEFDPLAPPRAIAQVSRARASEPLRRLPTRADDGLEQFDDSPMTSATVRRVREGGSPGPGLPERPPPDPGDRRASV